MIQIDPDDTELRDAINIAESLKKAYDKADQKMWNTSEKSALFPAHMRLRNKAMQAYESALINLALLFMERL